MKKMLFCLILILSIAVYPQEQKKLIDKVIRPCQNCPEYENIIMPFEFLTDAEHFLVLNLRRKEAFKKDVEMITVECETLKSFKVKYYSTSFEINCADINYILTNPDEFKYMETFDSKICPSFGKMIYKLPKKMLEKEFISFLGDRNTNELLIQTLSETLYIKRDGWEGWKLDRYIDKIFKNAKNCIVKKYQEQKKFGKK